MQNQKLTFEKQKDHNCSCESALNFWCVVMPCVLSLKASAVNLLLCFFCCIHVPSHLGLAFVIWCCFLDLRVTTQSEHMFLLSLIITYMQMTVLRCWHAALPCLCCLGVDRKVLCFSCQRSFFKLQKHHPFFTPTEILWCGNDQNTL